MKSARAKPCPSHSKMPGSALPPPRDSPCGWAQARTSLSPKAKTCLPRGRHTGHRAGVQTPFPSAVRLAASRLGAPFHHPGARHPQRPENCGRLPSGTPPRPARAGNPARPFQSPPCQHWKASEYCYNEIRDPLILVPAIVKQGVEEGHGMKIKLFGYRYNRSVCGCPDRKLRPIRERPRRVHRTQSHPPADQTSVSCPPHHPPPHPAAAHRRRPASIPPPRSPPPRPKKPTPPPAPTAEPDEPATALAPQAAKDCADTAAFFGDVTVPDGTAFKQNDPFVKTWRVRNEGTCTWGPAYSLIFYGGDPDEWSLSVQSDCPSAAPGAVVDVSVDLTAPSSGGAFTGLWEFQDPWGQRFGVGSGGSDPIWVKIGVSIYDESGNIKSCSARQPASGTPHRHLRPPAGQRLRASSMLEKINAVPRRART